MQKNDLKYYMFTVANKACRNDCLKLFQNQTKLTLLQTEIKKIVQNLKCLVNTLAIKNCTKLVKINFGINLIYYYWKPN